MRNTILEKSLTFTQYKFNKGNCSLRFTINSRHNSTSVETTLGFTSMMMMMTTTTNSKINVTKRMYCSVYDPT